MAAEVEIAAITTPTPSPMEEKEKPSTSTRFTNIEREILFTLFQQHEDIIDIKYRKTSRQKNKYLSVRECWERIVEEYNRNPHITTPRNLKQVQKFWLNSRLRKKYPSSANVNIESIKTEGAESQIPDHQNYYTKAESEDYETVEEIHSPENELNDTQDQCSRIDQISTEKLSLNDLLEFKNASRTAEVVVTREQENVNSRNSTSATHTSRRAPSRPRTSSRYMESETRHPPCCTNLHRQVSESVEDRINFFKLKEAELKYKEQAIRLQQKRLELHRARTELKHIKELHLLQVEEMKIKLRILKEEERSTKYKKDDD